MHNSSAAATDTTEMLLIPVARTVHRPWVKLGELWSTSVC